MNPLFYGFRYLNIAIAFCTAEQLLKALIELIEQRKSYLVAPIRQKDLLTVLLHSKNAKRFRELSLTFPTERPLQRAVIKDIAPEHTILSGKLFIDLMSYSVKNELSLLFCGTTDLEEIQLRDRFKLLLEGRPYAIYISETMEKNHNKEQLSTFIKKTNPSLVFITWRFYKKFNQIKNWLPQSVIFVFDVPLDIYTDSPARNRVLEKMIAFLGFFNIWKGLQKLSICVILLFLRKHRGNLKPL